MEINEFTSLEYRTPSYFDFLLDEKLLRKELTNNSDVSKAGFLISTFLHQVETTREINILQNTSDNKANEDVENDRTRSLRLLALKVASYFNWDLDYMNKHIPVNYVYTLLTDLIRCTTPGYVSQIPNPNLDVDAMSPEAVFALNLFCCWSLKFIVEANKPLKPNKTPQIQLPGLFNPCIEPPMAREAMFQILQIQEKECICLLEKIVMSNHKFVSMPTMKCFQFSSKNGSGSCDWSLCREVKSDEIFTLASYTLGSWYFFRRDFKGALKALEYCINKLRQVKNPVFLKIEISRIEGFLRACRGIMNAPPKTMSSPHEMANASIKSNDNNSVPDMAKDLAKEELSSELEEKSVSEKKVNIDDLIVNTLRKIMNGELVVPDFMDNIRKGKIPLNNFFKTFSDFCFNAPANEQNHLIEFLIHLSMLLPNYPGIRDFLMSEPLKRLYNEKDVKLFQSNVNEDILECNLTSLEIFTDSSKNIIISTNLEQKLLTCYCAKETVELLNQLFGVTDINRLMHQPAIINTLISKARTCKKLEMFDESRELLSRAESMAREINLPCFNLSHEIVTTELWKNIALKRSSKESMEKAKDYLQKFRRDREIKSKDDFYLPSIIHLLNIEQWKFLLEVQDEHQRFCELEYLGILIGALASRDQTPSKKCKKLAQHFLNRLAPIFVPQRQDSVSFERFMQFVSMINSEKSLAVIVSGLVKLLKISPEKESVTEISAKKVSVTDISAEKVPVIDISSDHEDFWPATINFKHQNLKISEIKDALRHTLFHGLQISNRNVSFVKTLADLYHEYKEFNSSVRCYIYFGVLKTKYFTSERYSFDDDETLKKMIRAFVGLKYFTRAAVMCQFLKEVDYETASKCVYERQSMDSDENYAECIWDVSLLELFVNAHERNGQVHKLRRAKQLMRSLELNGYRSAQALEEIAKVKKRKFLRKMANFYLSSYDPVYHEIFSSRLN